MRSLMDIRKRMSDRTEPIGTLFLTGLGEVSIYHNHNQKGNLRLKYREKNNLLKSVVWEQKLDVILF